MRLRKRHIMLSSYKNHRGRQGLSRMAVIFSIITPLKPQMSGLRVSKPTTRANQIPMVTACTALGSFKHLDIHLNFHASILPSLDATFTGKLSL